MQPVSLSKECYLAECIDTIGIGLVFVFGTIQIFKLYAYALYSSGPFGQWWVSTFLVNHAKTFEDMLSLKGTVLYFGQLCIGILPLILVPIIFGCVMLRLFAKSKSS